MRIPRPRGSRGRNRGAPLSSPHARSGGNVRRTDRDKRRAAGLALAQTQGTFKPTHQLQSTCFWILPHVVSHVPVRHPLRYHAKGRWRLQNSDERDNVGMGYPPPDHHLLTKELVLVMSYGYRGDSEISDEVPLLVSVRQSPCTHGESLRPLVCRRRCPPRHCNGFYRQQGVWSSGRALREWCGRLVEALSNHRVVETA